MLHVSNPNPKPREFKDLRPPNKNKVPFLLTQVLLTHVTVVIVVT